MAYDAAGRASMSKPAPKQLSMSQIDLLRAMRNALLEATSDLILPTSPDEYTTVTPAAGGRMDESKAASDGGARAAEIHLMRLPDSKAAKKKTPYIILQALTCRDSIEQEQGVRRCQTTVRAVYSVYCGNETEGSLALLNLIERCRIDLLVRGVLESRFTLDLDEGLQTLVYPDDTAPYYGGEMMSVWNMPAINREDWRKIAER